MKKTSEWVSLGHPDKMTDYISSYLLDRYLEKDPHTRYAVEVQIKDEFVSLAGEVTSKAAFTDEQIAEFVKQAVREIGYTAEYQQLWGKQNTISAEDLKVTIHIGQQSPDIAQGVDAQGWGDQGIFWGMADKNMLTHLPMDIFYARLLGEYLFRNASNFGLGLDIKTQITMDGDAVSTVIVAAPFMEHRYKEHHIVGYIKRCLGEVATNATVIFNGTGAYTIHGPRGDAGTTGRKLAVDFYGGNCRIGGGSPWTKDASKADLTLNLYARKLALRKQEERQKEAVYCSIACCIGKKEIDIVYYDQDLKQFETETELRPAEDIIAELRLLESTFAERCRKGLFHDITTR